MPALQTRCRFHAERAGIGVCTRCRAALCEGCAKRVVGILHCTTCLAAEDAAAPRRGCRSLSALAPALALLPLVWAGLGTGLYLLVSLIALAGEWLRSLQS